MATRLMVPLSLLSPPYRDSARARIDELAAEVAALPAVPLLRRAILPPSTRRELDTLRARVARALALPAGPAVVAPLAHDVEALRELHVRIAREIASTLARARAIPLPPAPKRFGLFDRRWTFDLEHAFCTDSLHDAPEVAIAPYGTGMSARLVVAEVPLVLVARGWMVQRELYRKHVDRVLRAAAPRIRAITVTRASGLSALARHFTAESPLVIEGDPDECAALLAKPVERALLALGDGLADLTVADGLVELRWTSPLSDGPLLPVHAVDAVTAIVTRLREGA